MTGSHEVEGSIPFRSTKFFKGFWEFLGLFFLKCPKSVQIEVEITS